MHILWHPLNGPICALEAVMDGDTQIYFQLLGADHLTFEGGGGGGGGGWWFTAEREFFSGIVREGS
jgi:hypothetical protein